MVSLAGCPLRFGALDIGHCPLETLLSSLQRGDTLWAAEHWRTVTPLGAVHQQISSELSVLLWELWAGIPCLLSGSYMVGIMTTVDILNKKFSIFLDRVFVESDPF